MISPLIEIMIFLFAKQVTFAQPECRGFIFVQHCEASHGKTYERDTCYRRDYQKSMIKGLELMLILFSQWISSSEHPHIPCLDLTDSIGPMEHLTEITCCLLLLVVSVLSSYVSFIFMFLLVYNAMLIFYSRC